MNKLFLMAVSAVSGVGGMMVGYWMAKRKYAAQADADIKAFREAMLARSKKEEEKVEKSPGEKSPETNPKPSGYYDYTSRAKPVNETKKASFINAIKPSEYGEDMSYETEDLTYYEANDVLVDYTGRVMSAGDIDASVGLGFKKSLGLYEHLTGYFKNDKLKVYYCVSVDEKTDYLKEVSTSPHLQEVVEG